MLKKILSIVPVIILMETIVLQAFAEDASITADSRILDSDEYYDGFYDDYRAQYGFSDDAETDDGLTYASLTEKRELQDAYIKLVEYCKTLEFETYPSYTGFVNAYRNSGKNDVAEYLAESLPLDEDIQSGSSTSDSWFYNTGLTLPEQATYSTYNLLSIVRKGDLLYETQGTSIVIFTGHIAVVEGVFWDESQGRFYIRLIEAVQDGVLRGVLDDTRLEQKGGKILRYAGITNTQRHAVVDFCISQLGKEYGIHAPAHASPDSEKWYCSELAWAAYKKAGLKLINSSNSLYVTPDEIYTSTKTQLLAVSTKKPATLFTDIDSSWAKSQITYLINNGILAGTSNSTFSPKINLNRGMVVSILYRLEGCPSISGTSKFADVSDRKKYYYDAVIWASSKGIVAGTTATTFSPNNNITPEQLVAFLYRYAAYKGYSTNYNSTSLVQFTDKGNISSYALTPMKWAVTNGIIAGTTATTISPQGLTAREQAAAFFYRFITRIM